MRQYPKITKALERYDKYQERLSRDLDKHVLLMLQCLKKANIKDVEYDTNFVNYFEIHFTLSGYCFRIANIYRIEDIKKLIVKNLEDHIERQKPNRDILILKKLEGLIS